MNYKEEDKKYVEAGGRVSYYDFTEKEIARVVKTNVKEVDNIVLERVKSGKYE